MIAIVDDRRDAASVIALDSKPMARVSGDYQGVSSWISIQVTSELHSQCSKPECSTTREQGGEK
jgi:hypothetical protein